MWMVNPEQRGNALKIPPLTQKQDRPLDFTSCDVQRAVRSRSYSLKLPHFLVLVANSPRSPASNILLLTMIIDDVDGKHDTSRN